jgi:hypothetical protein
MSGSFSRSFAPVGPSPVLRPAQAPDTFPQVSGIDGSPAAILQERSDGLFRLASINFHLRLHDSAPRTEVNVVAHPLFRLSGAYFKEHDVPGVRRIIRLERATELVQ